MIRHIYKNGTNMILLTEGNPKIESIQKYDVNKKLYINCNTNSSNKQKSQN